MLETITDSIPEIAKDVRLNLSRVLDAAQNEGLNEDQIMGSALAVANELGDKELIQAIKELIPNESIIKAAQLAASLMAMTNIYYRYTKLSDNVELQHLPAGLRMQGMMNPGVDKLTFETMCLAVSILNGCGDCIGAHANQLKVQGMSTQSLSRIGRIVAVMHAVYVSRNYS